MMLLFERGHCLSQRELTAPGSTIFSGGLCQMAPPVIGTTLDNALKNSCWKNPKHEPFDSQSTPLSKLPLKRRCDSGVTWLVSWTLCALRENSRLSRSAPAKCFTLFKLMRPFLRIANTSLKKTFPHRTIDALKGRRIPQKYKDMVQNFLEESHAAFVLD